MEQPSTDKEILGKGLKRLALSVLFIFTGPILIYLGAGSDHPIIFLMPGIAFSLLAIFLIFSGIMTVLDAMFKTKKSR